MPSVYPKNPQSTDFRQTINLGGHPTSIQTYAENILLDLREIALFTTFIFRVIDRADENKQGLITVLTHYDGFIACLIFLLNVQLLDKESALYQILAVWKLSVKISNAHSLQLVMIKMH